MSPSPVPCDSHSSERAVYRHIPGTTYRLQFNRDFTFQQAIAMLDYLRELGITDCYASPLFKARTDSTHGYDICDFHQLNPQLGSAEDFDHFTATRRQLGLGLILDMVPNHMSTDLSNGWWLDVLEKGQGSPYAKYFDIDWQPAHSELPHKVLLPILGDHYGKVLESGQLQLVFAAGAFWIAYYDRRFPVAPHSYAVLVREQDLAQWLELKDHAALTTDKAWAADGEERFASLKAQLAHADLTSEPFRERVHLLLKSYNGVAGSPSSFDRLHALLQAQHYRLAYWRVGPEEINYRRFFDISELVSVRMELPEVFEACHLSIARLLRQGELSGLRIDHPDGLWNPREYFCRLQEMYAQNAQPKTDRPLYVVVEKILSPGEPLPADWPVAGTTGYDFLNQLNGLFVDPTGQQILEQTCRDFEGCNIDFKFMVYLSKHHILEHSLASELHALAHRLKHLAHSTRHGLDLTFTQLHIALAAIIAAFPVYRTYLAECSVAVPAAEVNYIEQAVTEAKARHPTLDEAPFDFIRDRLLLQTPEDFDQPTQQQSRECVMRLQQLTGPAMAKGLEDTVFYNYHRLISLNEVGGNPEQFGVDLKSFHGFNSMRAKEWPHSLSATATHDTKRGEDARARLNVLSEMPGEWSAAVARWRRLNAGYKTTLAGQLAPHPSDEYLFYQSLLGAWLSTGECSDLRVRLSAFMVKAIREAKVRTTWTEPDIAYEEIVQRFVERTLDASVANPFLQDFTSFQRRVAFFGQFNSLAQVLLKMTAPGVPDFYQGTELWDFNLVDPDNRRPVDYVLRRQFLTDIRSYRHDDDSKTSAWLAHLLGQSHTGQVKLFTIYRALACRSRHRQLFEDGLYIPLLASGEKHDHVCAFLRSYEHQTALVIVPRLVARLAKGVEQPPLGAALWQDTWLGLPELCVGQKFQDVFTHQLLSPEKRGEEIGFHVSSLLNAFPVALLVSVE